MNYINKNGIITKDGNKYASTSTLYRNAGITHSNLLAENEYDRIKQGNVYYYNIEKAKELKRKKDQQLIDMKKSGMMTVSEIVSKLHITIGSITTLEQRNKITAKRIKLIGVSKTLKYYNKNDLEIIKKNLVKFKKYTKKSAPKFGDYTNIVNSIKNYIKLKFGTNKTEVIYKLGVSEIEFRFDSRYTVVFNIIGNTVNTIKGKTLYSMKYFDEFYEIYKIGV